jgi:glutathione S-transferase
VRARWALEEAAILYELEIVSREGPSGERHLTRHRLGRVPVLKAGEGRLVFESIAICLHAAEPAPEAGLIAATETIERPPPTSGSSSR